MKTYRIAVVEDQDHDYLRIKEHLDRFASEKALDLVVKHFSRAEQFLQNYQPTYDIVIMDIVLPGMNGMEAAHLLRQQDPRVLLIFLTNMSEYAIKGYEVNAIGYVMKPVAYHGLAMHLTNAVKRIDGLDDISIVLRFRDGVKVLLSRDITYIEVTDHDLLIHTVNGTLAAYGSLKDLEKKLTGNGFYRCSAWSLVNLRYVKDLFKDEITVGGDTVHISRSKRKGLLDALSAYLGGR